MMDVNISLKVISEQVETTESIGEIIGQHLKPADVVCLIGGLGAGKTALTRGIGKGWGTNQRVTSPTFTLVNEYSRPQDPRILFHLDCYRLMSENDVETIGLDDLLAAEGAVVIEWPQVAKDWIPADHLAIELDTLSENSRQITFKAFGPRSKIILKALKQQAIN